MLWKISEKGSARIRNSTSLSLYLNIFLDAYFQSCAPAWSQSNVWNKFISHYVYKSLNCLKASCHSPISLHFVCLSYRPLLYVLTPCCSPLLLFSCQNLLEVNVVSIFFFSFHSLAIASSFSPFSQGITTFLPSLFPLSSFIYWPLQWLDVLFFLLGLLLFCNTETLVTNFLHRFTLCKLSEMYRLCSKTILLFPCSFCSILSQLFAQFTSSLLFRLTVLNWGLNDFWALIDFIVKILCAINWLYFYKAHEWLCGK